MLWIYGSIICSSQVQKPPKDPPTGEWIKKTWRVHTQREAFQPLKKETLPCAATRMKLGGILLSEISQTDTDKYCLVSMIRGI